MPQFSRSLDIYQGFNFKKDKQAPVGFITKLLVGNMEFAPDQETLLDPLSPTAKLHDHVVGVLSHMLWETGTTDAMYLSAQVSTANKQKLAELLFGSFSNIEVKIKFDVYEYDPLAKNYFKSMWSDHELEGVLEKNGDALNMSVADDPSHEVQSPKNFTLQLGVKPQTKEQAVNMSTGTGKNVVKQWGVTETGSASS